MKNPSPLYDPRFEHDACGIGAVVDLTGRKTYATVDKALRIVEKLKHRAGEDAAGETGDGVGLLLQVPHKLMTKAAASLGIALGGERDYGAGMFFFSRKEKIICPFTGGGARDAGEGYSVRLETSAGIRAF